MHHPMHVLDARALNQIGPNAPAKLSVTFSYISILYKNVF